MAIILCANDKFCHISGQVKDEFMFPYGNGVTNMTSNVKLNFKNL